MADQMLCVETTEGWSFNLVAKIRPLIKMNDDDNPTQDTYCTDIMQLQYFHQLTPKQVTGHTPLPEPPTSPV